MRKRLFIVCLRGKKFPEGFDNWDALKEKYPTLSQFFGKKFEKPVAYTIRCGGRRSPIKDKHNWDGYMVDEKEYRLTPKDCLKLQGFPDEFKLNRTESEKYTRLGNTIPTNLTLLVGKKCIELLKKWNDLKDSDEESEESEESEERYNPNVYEISEYFQEVSLNTLSQIYKKSISLSQSKKAISGRKFENRVETILRDAKITFQRQVSIDENGTIQKRKKSTKNIPDIVVGHVVEGTNIYRYIVISCKKSCRERWKQDGWFVSRHPKLFMLANEGSDYPACKNFEESKIRKIATENPKTPDSRKFKLSLLDIPAEIKRFS